VVVFEAKISLYMLLNFVSWIKKGTRKFQIKIHLKKDDLHITLLH